MKKKHTPFMKKETQVEKIARLKDEFIKYLSAVPMYKFASMSIGRTEDCTRIWRETDVDFSIRCEAAKAEFVGRTAKKTKPEFQLERMFKDDFAELKKLGNPDGSPLQFTITRGEEEKK